MVLYQFRLFVCVTMLWYAHMDDVGALFVYTLLFICSYQAIQIIINNLRKEHLYIITTCCKVISIGMPCLNTAIGVILSFDPQRSFWEVFIEGMRASNPEHPDLYYCVADLDYSLIFTACLYCYLCMHTRNGFFFHLNK